jgi:hypothetical protein
MSREAMEKATSEIPSRSSRTLTKARPQLLDVGEKLKDEILGILPAAASYTSDVYLVITPTRIVGVGEDGSVEVWRYSDVKQVMFAGGKKKLFGGYDVSFFNIYLPNGNDRFFQLFGPYEYLHQVGTLAESACKKAQIANL